MGGGGGGMTWSGCGEKGSTGGQKGGWGMGGGEEDVMEWTMERSEVHEEDGGMWGVGVGVGGQRGEESAEVYRLAGGHGGLL